jgi:hypothetical protein
MTFLGLIVVVCAVILLCFAGIGLSIFAGRRETLHTCGGGDSSCPTCGGDETKCCSRDASDPPSA